jgi:hypothetical protein
MPAEFRIDQVSPGAGVPGRTRHDLVPNEVIALVATSPTGPGVTYAWEILDKVGSTAVLSSSTGASVTLGPNTSVVRPCSFRIRLTVNDNGVITSMTRRASVRTLVTGMFVPLFPESALQSGTLASHNPDSSEDNAVYTNRAGLGIADQNWRGWAEWAYEMVLAVESGGGAGGPPTGPAGGDLGGTYPNPDVVRLRGRSIENVAPNNNDYLRWDSGTVSWRPTTFPAGLPPTGAAGGDLALNYPNPTVAQVQGFPVQSGTPTTNEIWRFNGVSWVRVDHGSFIDGTVAAPSIHFESETGTGIYRPAANTGALSANGVDALRWQNNAGNMQALVTDGGQITPGLAFISEPSSGLYRVGANLIAVTVGGTAVSRFSTAGLNAQVLSQAGSAAAPVYSFIGDPNTGLYNNSADQQTFVCGGSPILLISTANFQPGSNGTIDLGTASNVFKSVWSISFRAYDGTAAVPTYSFYNEADSGMWRPGADIVGISVSTVEVARFQAPASANPQLLVANGTVTAPSLSFINGPTTGMYLKVAGANDTIGWTLDGADAATLSALQLAIPPGFNSSAPGLVSTLVDWLGINWFTSGFTTRMNAAGMLEFIRAGDGVPGSWLTLATELISAVGDETAFSASLTVNKAAGSYSAFKYNVAEVSAPGAANRLLDLQVGSVPKFYVTSAGAARASDGSQSDPGFAFITSGSGFYYSAGSTIAAALAGVTQVHVDNGSFRSHLNLGTDLGTAAVMWNVAYIDHVRVGPGSAPSPSLSFAADDNTGVYNPAADTLAISTAGSIKLSVDTTSVTSVLSHYAPDGTVLAPAYTFTNEPTTGMYRVGLNQLGLTVGGGIKLSLENTRIGATQPLQEITGGAAAPSYSFTDDPDTGMYRANIDTLAFATGGTIRAYINTTALNNNLVYWGPNASAANPAYSFLGDDASGMYLIAGSQLGFSTGGTPRVTIANANVTSTIPLLGPNGAVGAPTYSFSGDPNTGIYTTGADTLAFTTGGVLRVTLDSLSLTNSSLFFGPNGTAALPTYSFTNDPNTGLYSVGADQLGVSVGGTLRVTFNADDVLSTIPLEFVAAAFTTPASTDVQIGVPTTAGRPTLLAQKDANFGERILASAAYDRFHCWIGSNGGATPDAMGCTTGTSGTITAGAFGSTSFRLASHKLQLATSTTAGTSSDIRTTTNVVHRGAAAGRGGFVFHARLTPNTSGTAGYRGFVGLTSSGATLANGDPSALLNIIGLGFDAADANLQIMHNDGTGAATKVSTGISARTADLTVDVWFYAPPNGGNISWWVNRLDAAGTASGTISADMPATSQFLCMQCWINNGAVASAAAAHLMRMVVEAPQ